MLRPLLAVLALALCALQAIAIPINILPAVAQDQTQLAIMPPLPNVASSAPSAPPVLHDKRYYYPETQPDEDELEAFLKEKSMREAGFVSAPPAQSTQFLLKQKVHNSLPDADADAPIAVPMHPSTLSSPTSSARAIITYRWENISGDLWPPFSFFVVASALVCMFTIVRGIRSKT